MLKILLIFLGSGLGGVMRYGLTGWVHARTTELFPTGTLVVNLSGCLAIGFLGAVFAGPVLIREEYRVALLVGLLGGFTTFATFGRETFSLASDRELLFAVVNIVLSVVLGVGAVWLGTRVAEYIYGA